MKEQDNTEILIGKEPGKGRLMLSVKSNGNNRIAYIGSENSVPNSVSRCRPADGVGHCLIAIDENGIIRITNLKPQNTTRVNDIEIESKTIEPSVKVTIGKDNYPLNIKAIIELSEKIDTQDQSVAQESESCSIKPLQEVWNTYYEKTYELQIRQRRQAKIRSLYMPLVLVSGAAGFGVKYLGLAPSIASVISSILWCLAALMLFYGTYLTFTDRTIEEKRELEEEFHKKYVCPNPQCNNFMGTKPYSDLRKQKACPYCKTKFTEI